MKPERIEPRFTLIADEPTDTLAAFADDVRRGMGADPKWASCRWFYDAEGSRLFEEICGLEEYYLTRAETEILEVHADSIAERFGTDLTCVELGSGSAAKTRRLIRALLAAGRHLTYVPVDISRTALVESAAGLLAEEPELQVIGVAGEYRRGMEWMADNPDREKLVLWLGSNIGNLDRPSGIAFVRQIREHLTPRDRLLIGVDLRKEREVLERAYDDEQGITARFNLNVLARVNRELGGHFDLGAFAHRAVYEEEAGRVTMHLESLREQEVSIDGLDLVVRFAEGEKIHTENSYKYSLQEIDALAAASGFEVTERWLDSGSRFALNLLAPSAGAAAPSG